MKNSKYLRMTATATLCLVVSQIAMLGNATANNILRHMAFNSVDANVKKVIKHTKVKEHVCKDTNIAVANTTKTEKPIKVKSHKSPSTEEIIDGIKKGDLQHTATWYRTEGSIVHRNYHTAAYNHTPIGTKLLVINTVSGDSCIVEVTDRMAKGKRNYIDLSHSAFGSIARHAQGVARVLVKLI